MDKALKVLLLEDMKTDQELVKRQVLKFAPQSIFTIADSKASFYEKIEWFLPDMILADYNLPGFSGLDALFYFKEHLPEVPFIFVTGELNDEEKVAETVLYGADAYILKENLEKIPEILKEVTKRKQEKVNKRLALEEKIKKHQLDLQKAHQLLLKAPDFETKNAIIEIMERLTETLKREATKIK